MKTFFLVLILVLLPLSLMSEDKKLTQEQLDQMMAPVALYPDALLSQMLMAATYPDQVKEAVEWSKKNDNKLKGDEAVKAVNDKQWDPSVASLVAFAQVLDMMGKKPDWVKQMGDAFLAEPDKVMDTVQGLRKKAKDEGNLKSSKEQTVNIDDTNGTQVIIIEPASPQTVYVPVYNPTYVYGPWMYPAYPPYYYYPPYYHPPASGFFFGFTMGIVVGNCMWGGFHWRSHDVSINVYKHNSIHVHHHINVKGTNASWKHDVRPNNPRASKKVRDDHQRDLQRQKAQNLMKNKGIDTHKERKNLSKERTQINNKINNLNRDKSQFSPSKGVTRDNLSKPSSFDRREFDRPSQSFDKPSRNFGGSSHNFGGGGARPHLR
jgi:hypothetical protein